jgi:cell division protein FtsW
MIALARNDHSIVGRWWWTVDRWSLAALILMIGIGAILIMAASPAIADRMGVDSFYFVRRQVAFMLPALVLMFGVSLLSPTSVRRLAVVGLGIALILMVVTMIAGVEVNGARRWLRLGGISLQVSEFVKPSFVVAAAWLFASQRTDPGFPANAICFAVCALIIALLMLQPDFSMAVLIAAVWFAQYFLAGLHLGWMVALAGAGAAGAAAAYAYIPHITSRIDRFIDPAAGDSYQVDTALEAFMNGGLLGRGPGEGVVKQVLPDAHSDFVFAVAGEEFGLLLCLAIIVLFGFVVLRGFGRVMRGDNLFVLLAVGGLLVQFGLQALLHMGVTLGLVPPTGMTLPFVSYGGSSIIAIALGMGMMLALTRRPRSQGGMP